MDARRPTEGESSEDVPESIQRLRLPMIRLIQRHSAISTKYATASSLTICDCNLVTPDRSAPRKRFCGRLLLPLFRLTLSHQIFLPRMFTCLHRICGCIQTADQFVRSVPQDFTVVCEWANASQLQFPWEYRFWHGDLPISAASPSWYEVRNPGKLTSSR